MPTFKEYFKNTSRISSIFKDSFRSMNPIWIHSVTIKKELKKQKSFLQYCLELFPCSVHTFLFWDSVLRATSPKMVISFSWLSHNYFTEVQARKHNFKSTQDFPWNRNAKSLCRILTNVIKV